MQATAQIGTRPVVKGVEDAPTPGPVAVATFTVKMRDQETTAQTVRLLGHGRDALDRDALVADMTEATDAVNASDDMTGSYAVSDVFETITEALEHYPEADLIDSTARRMYRAELARLEQAAAVEAWEDALLAAGRECCDRCGGAGGYRGWPGFTCHKCNGRGHVEREDGPAYPDPSATESFHGDEGRRRREYREGQ